MPINAVEQSTERFEFGENWKAFSALLNDERVVEAENSLKEMLQVNDLDQLTFLDIGSGSGLFSLAAKRLGALVRSFDYDPQSVACTLSLKKQFYPDDPWIVEQASILDNSFVDKLGTYDIVYSWGVLHHTGAMWWAIENAISRVGPRSKLFIAIYNDQGWKSHFWWFIKFFYNKLPSGLNTCYAYFISYFLRGAVFVKRSLKSLLNGVISGHLLKENKRGMSNSHDMIDWIGGFPYEFASLEVLVEYMKCRDFKIIKAKEVSSLGCHQLVFERIK